MRRLSKSEPISDGIVFVFHLAFLMRKSGFESLKWYIFFNTSDHVMLYFLYKNQWNTKPFYLNSVLVWKVRIIIKP